MPEDPNQWRSEEAEPVLPPPHTHHPQFIFLEDGHRGQRRQSAQEHFAKAEEESPAQAFEQLGQLRYLWSLRLTALGLSPCMYLVTLAMLILTFLAATAVVCTLGKHEPTRLAFRQVHMWLRKSAALALGFSVAIISPPFGLAIILVYFFLLGERLNAEILNRFVSASK